MQTDSTVQPVTRRIAEHFAAAGFDDLPPSTRHATSRALLDAMGVMLAATTLAPDARPFRDQAIADGGVPDARLLGCDARVPMAAAAFANGALGHALDFGDTFDAGPAHPNAALVPALLAIADAHSAIDRQAFLTAMALGSDLACRISLAPARPFEDGGWYPPPFAGTIGAAAGCAKLLGLDADGIVQAIGLALCQASFPAEIKFDADTRLRGVREGFAARAAVSGALLARRGVRAFAAPLEGRGGFFALHGGGLRADVLLADMGARFLGDEVSFKPWPACRGTHAYIEAALALRSRIALAEITLIEVEIGPVQEMLVEPRAIKVAPSSAIDAKFSIPFTVAAALVHGAVTLDTFAPAALTNPQVRAIADKVVPVRNRTWGRVQAASGSVTIVMQDGQRLHLAIPQAAGHPDYPTSDEDLRAKFVDCAMRAAMPMTRPQATRLADTILAVDDGADFLVW
ncbi:MmgE/PrpD family protein [uncultured Sphingomonas sp.]|uniref:MmgE/PrpD family protein n=1 Tax=uncultured Sphingomonas sp. TaxID=158754 RepID=UPI0025EF245B|nr:MmgE/PrpD family protein [uncultured Sphingomonas sp.]